MVSTFRGLVHSRLSRISSFLKTKVDQSAETALNQIREKEYSKLFTPRLKQGYTLHNVGISFSSEKRRIEEFKEEIISYTP